MQPDPHSDPGQENTEVELADLLLEPLDGGDPVRAAMVLRLINLRSDQDRAADLARLREAGTRPVVTL